MEEELYRDLELAAAKLFFYKEDESNETTYMVEDIRNIIKKTKSQIDGLACNEYEDNYLTTRVKRIAEILNKISSKNTELAPIYDEIVELFI